jgi:hypothetical protein
VLVGDLLSSPGRVSLCLGREMNQEGSSKQPIGAVYRGTRWTNATEAGMVPPADGRIVAWVCRKA